MGWFSSKKKMSINKFTKSQYSEVIAHSGELEEEWQEKIMSQLMMEKFSYPTNDKKKFLYELTLAYIEYFSLTFFLKTDIEKSIKQGMATKEYFWDNEKIWSDLKYYNETTSQFITFTRKDADIINHKRLDYFSQYAKQIKEKELLHGVSLSLGRLGAQGNKTLKDKIHLAYGDRLMQKFSDKGDNIDLEVQILGKVLNIYRSEARLLISKYKWT